MFKNRVIEALKKVVGWKDHWDSLEIPALPTSLTDTESGMTYQSFLPSLVRLDYIQAMLPSNRTLEEYLDTVETDAINTMLSDLVERKKLSNKGKDVVKSNVILDNVVRGKTVVNESRFVGIEISLNGVYGIEAVINRIGLYLSGNDTDIDLYLFNSLQANAVATYNISTITANTFNWTDANIEIEAENGTGTDGGVWYIGYYQDDLAHQAVQLESFNWKNGYCGGCRGEKYAKIYRNMSSYVRLTPFYIAAAKVPATGVLFDPADIVETYNNNWGLNLNLTVKCDLSQYFIDNRQSFKSAIGHSVAYQVLQMLSVSSQVSAVEQNIQPLALSTLEGVTGTKTPAYRKIVSNAIEAVYVDQGNQGESPCLPCTKKSMIWGFA